MNMVRSVVDPTYVLLDEFQHFVGPDLYDALPIVRQLGLRLILAHQSFAQLERGDIDLSGIIWQARSRLMFANDADDADRIAHELATLTYDPMKLKEVLFSRKQRIAGHRKEWLESTSRTTTSSLARDIQESQNYGTSSGESRAPRVLLPTEQRGSSAGSTRGTSEKRGQTDGASESRGETLVPVHEDFLEISNKSYFSFDDQRTLWAQKLRQKPTGEAFAKFKDDPRLYDIAIDHDPRPSTRAIEEAVEDLIARNFETEFFVPAAEVERQSEHLRKALLQGPPIIIESRAQTLPAQTSEGQIQSQSSDALPTAAPSRDPVADNPFT
jgi:hypothetical protein